MTGPDPAPGMPSIAESFGRFARRLRFEDIPPEVVAAAKRSILDSLGIAIRGLETPQARTLLAEVRSWGGIAEATVPGTDLRFPAVNAGLVGGLLCHSFDFDDTHLPAIVHPSACVVPAALAAAETGGGDGREFLTLAVIGYETMIRVGRAASGQFQLRGLHATSICGTIAVACLAARALGGDEAAIARAVGAAASLASGILEPAHDGTWTKLLQAGWAVHSGLVAARLGRREFLAPRLALEGEFGLYRALVGDRFDPADAVSGLGRTWETPAIAIKLYPACHHLQAFLDIALELIHADGLRAENVDSIEFVIGAPQSRIVCDPWADKCAPRSDYAARFSLPYAVGCALVDGQVTLDQYAPERLSDPRVQRLVGTMRFQAEPNPEVPRRLAGEIRVATKDGRRLTRRRENCRGASADDPIRDDDVKAKFMANVVPVLGADRARAVVALVGALETATVAEVLSCVRRGGAAGDARRSGRR